MPNYKTYTHLSLLKWCTRVHTTSELLSQCDSIYIDRPELYEYFGPPYACISDDLPRIIGAHNTNVDNECNLSLVTRALHVKSGDKFIASLDNVVVQRYNNNFDRFLLLLADGIVAAETYKTSQYSSYFPKVVGERIVVPITNSRESVDLLVDVYDAGPVDTFVTEPCVMLASVFMFNYAHFLCEVMPRLWYLDAAPELAGFPIIIPPYPPDSFQGQMLDAVLGDRPRYWPFGNRVAFTKLFYPSFMAPSGYSREQMKWIRDNIRSRFYIDDKKTKRHKIYISRSDATTRRVLNEDAIFETLRKIGFEKVTLSKLSQKEKIELFSGAETIVAPFGAGNVNAIFSSPGTRFVEFIPASFSVGPDAFIDTWIYCNLSDFYYSAMICPSYASDDITVDEYNLMKILDALPKAEPSDSVLHWAAVS